MATVFIRTNEGAAHDHAVMMGNTPSAGIAAIVCYDGAPVLDVTDIKALTAATAGHESYRIVEALIPQTDINPTSTLLEPELPEQLDGVQVNALGYLLENGVLWGYVPYRPDKSGLTKTNDFSWALKLVCTSSDSPTIEVQYSSLDLRQLGDRLYAAAYERLRTAFYGTLCNITAAPLHEAGECIEIPLNESQIINTETAIVAEPISGY